jgi:stearoyl-CoA desaturase (delta-9 desaturase)
VTDLEVSGRAARRPRLDAADLAPLRPWREPWWRPTPGDGPVFYYMILIHLGALAALVLAPLPGWPIALVAYGVHFLGGLGTTVCYHRAIAHRTVKLHPAVRQVLTFLAMFNGSGAPLSWAAYHRLHHAKSDTPEDISSPRVGGFWWSHLRWLWQAGAPPIQKYCKEIDRPAYRFWAKVQIPILAVSVFGALPFGWAAFLWIGPLRLVWALHAQCFVNSICHMRKVSSPDEATAKNVPWLALMHGFQGENWHQNHHDRPGSARLGFKLAQLDVGWYTILLLERLGLATDVRRPDLTRSLDVAA